MATPASVVTVPLAQGLELKVDSKQAPIGSMLQLQNVVMSRPGQIQKRPGWQALSKQVISGDKVTNGVALATFNNELFLFDGVTAYSFYPDPTNPGWVPKGTFTSVSTDDSEVVRNVFTQTTPDCAVLGDLALYAYMDSRGGARCTVKSVSTGNVLLYDKAIDSNATCVRCVSFGGVLYVVYTQGNDLKSRAVNPLQPNVLQDEVVLLAGLSDPTTGYYDFSLNAAGTTLFVGIDSTSSNVLVRGFNTSLQTFDTTSLGSSRMQAIQADSGSTLTGQLWLSVVSGSTPVLQAYDQNTLTTKTTVPFLSVPSGYTGGSVTLVEADPSTHAMVGFWGDDATSQTFTAPFSTVLNTPTMRPWMLGVTPLSKGFVSSGQPYLTVQHQSPQQATAFVVTADTTHRVIAKDRYMNLGPAARGRILSTPAFDQAGAFHVALASGQAPSGIGELTLDFGSTETFFNAQVDQNAFVVSGGGLQSYDGISFVEQNFYLFPDTVTAVPTATGDLSVGTYQYVACYAWQDNQGQTTRSTTTVPVEATTIDGVGGAGVFVTVSTLTITDRDPTSVQVEVYRTQVNTTGALNRVAVLQNDPTVSSVSFNDTMSDLDALSQLVLYTDGGAVIDYSPAPPCGLVTVFKDRVWVAGIPGQPNTLAFSNVSVPGQAVQFNATNTLQVDSAGGQRITAMAVLNDQLVAFKERSMWLVSGDGPNPGGGGNPYTTPYNASSDTGCANPNSLVLVGNMSSTGLVFRSAKGIYGVSPQWAPKYIGAPVEGFNSQTITSGELLADQNVVRFALQSPPPVGTLPNQGSMLAFDYYVNQWVSYTGLDAVDSVVYNDVHTVLKPDGTVWQEAAGSFTDPYGFFPLLFETNEIRPFGPQALFRPQAIWVEAQYLGPHTLRCSIAYDNAPFTQQVSEVNATDVFSGSLPTYGNGAGTYGNSTTGSIPGAATYGGLYASYNLLFTPTRPCHSMRIKIEEVADSRYPNDQGGLTISNLRLECTNLNRGPYVPDTQSG